MELSRHQGALDAMRESARRAPTGGSIINIASVSALVGSPDACVFREQGRFDCSQKR